MKSRFELDFLETSSEVLRAIAHPIRIAIVDLLKVHPKLSVTEIHEQLHIEQAIASHHLRILKEIECIFSFSARSQYIFVLEDTEVMRSNGLLD
ncbi:MAG: helix-turn-helix domain-containing protein, partial [Bacteroidota bacterium]